MAPDLRVDELTGDQVILAPARASRPDTFRVQEQALPRSVDTCPFCPGHEHETPPEVARVGAGEPDTPGWRVRVVPNKFPFAPAHEVVILSPAHDADFGALDDTAAIDALGALRDRAAFHLATGSRHAQAFINSGKAAGASIEHPHAQLVALDTVPPRVEQRLDRFSPERLAADQAHLIVDGDTQVWCGRAPTSPFATRCSLREGGARFDTATDDEIRVVALTLRNTIRALHFVLGGVAYNVVIETAPRDDARPFHWWIDIVPRVSVLAGFELGTGVYVNVVDPATAADVLRVAK